MIVKTCFAQRKVFGHLAEIFDLHIPQRVCLYNAAYFLCGMGGGNQLLVGRDIRAEIARMHKRR